jgi:hypothetical protein
MAAIRLGHYCKFQIAVSQALDTVYDKGIQCWKKPVENNDSLKSYIVDMFSMGDACIKGDNIAMLG